jgi:quinoprotein glucose dehydrogenase
MGRKFTIVYILAIFSMYVSCSTGTGRDSLGREKKENTEEVLEKESYKTWQVYGGDKEGTHYSSLNQINQDNVSELQVAWTYSTGDKDPQNRTQIQCNPIIVDTILYGSSPGFKFFAINAATGKQLWTFNPLEGEFSLHGVGVNRGLAYWSKGDKKKLFFTANSYLYSLDAITGKLIASFGENGRVELRKGLGDRSQNLFVISNTPGIIYKDLLILGTRVSEDNNAAPGYIRAYNVHTGNIEWTFHTIPHPGEYGYDSWPKDAWQRIGGANAWSGMSLDEEKGIVFIPTGSASYDFYGGNRHGENLFANSVLALNAQTGERIWHYQTVHHDLWDRDLPATPNLVTVEHDGKRIKAVAQITKTGFVFLLDRYTGKPLFPVVEKKVPSSTLPGEKSWPTQPFPSKPEPFVRHEFKEEDIWDLSKEFALQARQKLRTIRKDGGPFTPPSLEGSLIFPGFDGGGEWGGAAYDPKTNLLYVNANEMPWIQTMVPIKESKGELLADLGKSTYMVGCSSCHGLDRKGSAFMGGIPSLLKVKDKLSSTQITSTIKNGKGVMPSFEHLSDEEIEEIVAYLSDSDKKVKGHSTNKVAQTEIPYVSTGYIRFVDENGYPAIKPPWGTLNAIDLNTGLIKWKIPLGEYKELTKKGIPITGTENYGGPIVTAGGLVFIAATKDEHFRAFDKASGKLLWEIKLPAGGYATPSTYQIDGKQYIVIASGGGKMDTKSGDSYIAFALPN